MMALPQGKLNQSDIESLLNSRGSNTFNLGGPETAGTSSRDIYPTLNYFRTDDKQSNVPSNFLTLVFSVPF